MDTEWHKLRNIGGEEGVSAWDEYGVREWRQVRDDCSDLNNLHVGSLHELCVEKGSELELGNKERKYKGRVVFLGDRVNYGWGYNAVFEELSSSPASMEAGKICDMWGCLPNHTIQQADGTQAYCQSELKGNKQTWIRLPVHKWPDHWKRSDGSWMYHDPVVPLTRALYGHPDSGGFWERHCEEQIKDIGFKPIGKCFAWRSCFWHPEWQLLLTIYVDDFKMAGPAKYMKDAWKRYRTR